MSKKHSNRRFGFVWKPNQTRSVQRTANQREALPQSKRATNSQRTQSVSSSKSSQPISRKSLKVFFRQTKPEIQWKTPNQNLLYPKALSLFQTNSKTALTRKEKPSLCEQRHNRRKVLFQMRIAGTGKRKSPGQGGTYKRTELSKVGC